MTDTFRFKRGDTRPILQATLRDLNGSIDLTTAVVVKLLLKTADGVTAVTGNCTIVDAPNGKVTYTWVSPNTSVPGVYRGEFEITWGTGLIETVPSGDPSQVYFTVEFVEDLG